MVFMKIVVCIKQVPDTTEVKLDPETNALIREGVPSIVNPFDMYAIEEGLRLREKIAGSTVTAITMGPPQAADALREVIAVGVDDAIHLCDRKLAISDTWATSYALSCALKKIGADITICGKQAIDGDTAQVGPGIAEWLDIPFVAFVKKIQSVDSEKIVVERMMETGFDVIESPLPVVITVVKEINEPRIPSLKGKMRAKKAEIVTWTAKDIDAESSRIGLEGSPTKVVKIFTPPPRTGGRMLNGEPGEIAVELVEMLKPELL